MPLSENNELFVSIVTETLAYDNGTVDLKTRINGLDTRLTADEAELHCKARNDSKTVKGNSIQTSAVNDKANSKNLITLSLILNLIHFAGLSRFEEYPVLLALFFSGGLGLSIYIASIDWIKYKNCIKSMTLAQNVFIEIRLGMKLLIRCQGV